MATTNAHVGKILQTSPTGEHTIISEDGSHYSFSQSHWQAINPPQVGDAVQFSFDEAGQVIGVMRRDVVAGETSQRMDSAAPDAGYRYLSQAHPCHRRCLSLPTQTSIPHKDIMPHQP